MTRRIPILRDGSLNVMNTTSPKGKEPDDETDRRSRDFQERIAAIQNKARALGLTATLSEAEQKAYMDDQWGEKD